MLPPSLPPSLENSFDKIHLKVTLPLLLQKVESKGRLITITSTMLFPKEINIMGLDINYPKTLNVLDGTEATKPLTRSREKNWKSKSTSLLD